MITELFLLFGELVNGEDDVGEEIEDIGDDNDDELDDDDGDVIEMSVFVVNSLLLVVRQLSRSFVELVIIF